MTTAKPRPARPAAFSLGAADLHDDPLISAAGLLKLMDGANAMSLSRWRKTQGMPHPVRHGKYSLSAMLRWVWSWKVQLDEELESSSGSGARDEVLQELQQIKLQRERLSWNLESKQYGALAEWEEAEAARIQLAVSALHTIPDRLIDEQLAPEGARTRMLELLGEIVDTLKNRIQQGDVPE